MAKRTNIEDQLRRAIVQGPMTRYALSKQTGVAQSILSDFVNGNRSLTLTTASKLADVLGLEITKVRPVKKSIPKGR